MSEVFATLSTSLNQRAPADIPLERKSPDLHGAGIFRRPAVFDYSWTTRDASASWRWQGTLRGNLRAVRFSALWGALLPTLERKSRFTASSSRFHSLARISTKSMLLRQSSDFSQRFVRPTRS